ncbi:Uncharacterised protein [uncultured archaeon]|nr:Uncharacterised protein [uncultured archaeon]
MKAIKIVLDPAIGWHIRNPATYRIERTYPVIPPTVLFGIVQNLLNTSSHKTTFKKFIALGGFPSSNVGLSLEMQRIVKIKGKEDIVGDRHEIEVAHTNLINSYLLVPDELSAEYVSNLRQRVGDIVLLTTNQFPVTLRKISEHEVLKTKSKKLLFGLAREGMGFPYVLPLRYEFGKTNDYRTQQYWRVLLPFVPVVSDKSIRKADIELFEEVDSLSIDGANFDAELVKLCENKWHKSIAPLVGTI